jgi:Holliday junction resolvasome RuvABC endonuclease subunit
MRLVTLDINSKFLAYALWEDQELVRRGKIYLKGDNFGYFAVAILEYFANDDLDAFVYEAPFFGTNVKTTMMLSQIIGSVISGFYMLGVDSYRSVPPITWQTGIGVGKTPTSEMVKLKSKHPKKSSSYIKNLDRMNRKQRVIDKVNSRFDLQLSIEEHDIADAIAIGMYVFDSNMRIK